MKAVVGCAIAVLSLALAGPAAPGGAPAWKARLCFRGRGRPREPGSAARAGWEDN